MNQKITISYEGGDTTQRLHAKGAELDGAAWLTINMALADNLRVYADVGAPAVKELLSRAALVALVALQKAGHLPVPNAVLDALEGMARNHCYVDTTTRAYQGAAETNVTDSGGLSADADALRVLAQHGRFRIEREEGRMVVGYWPEHDPKRKEGQP